jgi:hypothetical protein
MTLSIVLAVGGLVVVTALQSGFVGSVRGGCARQDWLLGLAALFPAWLMTFLALLPSAVGSNEASLPRPALFSSAVALGGIIFSDLLIRRLSLAKKRPSPFLATFLGWAALLPAWIIALVALS